MKNHFVKSIVSLLCVLCLSLPMAGALAYTGPQPLSVFPSSALDYAQVHGTATLNLRDGPGKEYNWLGNAPEGAWVAILGESGNWYSVCILEGQRYGYMSKNFLRRSQGGSMGSTGIVNNPKSTQFLNLRQYPSYSAPVLGIFYNGAQFRVLSSIDGWYQVEIGGQIGYFRKEFVLVNGASGSGEAAYVRTPNRGKVNLRNAPTYKGSTVIAQFPNGSPVQVLLRSTAATASPFWKVSVQGVTGYIDSAFLSLQSSGGGGYYPPQPPKPPKPQTHGYAIVNNPKATQYLNLREQPSAYAKVIAQYRNGIRFEVIEQGKNWCKVYGSATGNVGYMMTKFLSLHGLPATPIKTVQNGNSFVNLRSSPSKQTGTVYDRVYSGAQVIVLTPGDEWTQVQYGSTVGYMMTYFLH